MRSIDTPTANVFVEGSAATPVSERGREYVFPTAHPLPDDVGTATRRVGGARLDAMSEASGRYPFARSAMKEESSPVYMLQTLDCG